MHKQGPKSLRLLISNAYTGKGGCMKKGYMEVCGEQAAAYQRWIDRMVREKCQGYCREKAEAMAEKFPELRVVGAANFFSGHCWCLTQNDEVVDPTAHQFNGIFPYPRTPEEGLLEKEDFPTGKCPECGELIWPDTPYNRQYHSELIDHDFCMEQFWAAIKAEEEELKCHTL